MTNTTKAPTWFTLVAVLAILWNLMGVMAYLSQAFMTQEMMEALPQEQQEAYSNVPEWATAAFALSVFGGLLGSLFLVLKKNIAGILLWISLVSIVINDIYNFMIIDSVSLFGMLPLIMQSIVLIVAIGLILMFKKAKSSNWI